MKCSLYFYDVFVIEQDIQQEIHVEQELIWSLRIMKKNVLLQNNVNHS